MRVACGSDVDRTRFGCGSDEHLMPFPGGAGGGEAKGGEELVSPQVCRDWVGAKAMLCDTTVRETTCRRVYGVRIPQPSSRNPLSYPMGGRIVGDGAHVVEIQYPASKQISFESECSAPHKASPPPSLARGVVSGRGGWHKARRRASRDDRGEQRSPPAALHDGATPAVGRRPGGLRTSAGGLVVCARRQEAWWSAHVGRRP
eukprot:gene12343-biopygen14009